MTKKPEMIEGAEASARFRDAMKSIVSVPHATIQKRIAEHKRKVARNPHRRGPKPRAR